MAARGVRVAAGRRLVEVSHVKKSIGDNMIPQGWGLDRGLALVKKAGFDGIELWLGANPWLQPTTTDQQVADLLKRVKNAGLVVSNVSNTFDWDFPISSRDP